MTVFSPIPLEPYKTYVPLYKRLAFDCIAPQRIIWHYPEERRITCLPEQIDFHFSLVNADAKINEIVQCRKSTTKDRQLQIPKTFQLPDNSEWLVTRNVCTASKTHLAYYATQPIKHNEIVSVYARIFKCTWDTRSRNVYPVAITTSSGGLNWSFLTNLVIHMDLYCY